MADHPGSACDVAESAAEDSTDGLIEADLLVEDVSIDGMCGVY